MFQLIKYFHLNDWAVIQNKFTDLSDKQKKLLLIQNFKNPELVIIFGLMGGAFALDRFYIGDIFIGILKLAILLPLIIFYLLSIFLIIGDVYLGLIVIFWIICIIDIFLCYKRCKTNNFQIFSQAVSEI